MFDLAKAWSRIRVVFALAAACVPAAQSRLPQPSPANWLSIKISTAKASFKTGSRIQLNVAFTNTGEKDMSFRRSPADDQWTTEPGQVIPYRVEATDEQGKAAPESRRLRALRGEMPATEPVIQTWSGPSNPIIRAGETINVAAIASDLYDLSKPGKYTIQVSRMDPETKVLVKSNLITITITP